MYISEAPKPALPTTPTPFTFKTTYEAYAVSTAEGDTSHSETLRTAIVKANTETTKRWHRSPSSQRVKLNLEYGIPLILNHGNPNIRVRADGRGVYEASNTGLSYNYIILYNERGVAEWHLQ
jgi:hypothetical protein